MLRDDVIDQARDFGSLPVRVVRDRDSGPFEIGQDCEGIGAGSRARLSERNAASAAEIDLVFFEDSDGSGTLGRNRADGLVWGDGGGRHASIVQGMLSVVSDWSHQLRKSAV